MALFFCFESTLRTENQALPAVTNVQEGENRDNRRRG